MRKPFRTIATRLNRRAIEVGMSGPAWVLYVGASILAYFLNAPLAMSALGPAAGDSEWKQTGDWSNGQTSATTTLTASIASLQCPIGMSLEFPNIMHARQDIFIDGKLIATNGNAQSIRSIYGAPIVPCSVIKGSTITWRIEAFVRSFAKLKAMPKVSSSNSINRSEAMHLTTFGSNFLISIFLLASSWKTVFFRQALRIAAFSIAAGLFFALSVLGLLGIQLDVITADKAAGLAIGVAITSLVSFLHKRNYVHAWFNRLSSLTCALAMGLVIFLEDGDQIQGVLDVMFLPGVIGTWMGLFTIAAARDTNDRSQKILSILALASFAASISFDLAYTYGLHNWGMSLAYGITGMVLFFALGIQAEIRAMNLERDHLRANLATEVAIKTSSLEKALADLKSTQAELIQSAKLASLGTLSAGIAHEINNSLNYVNGAMQPLEKLVTKSFAGGFQGDDQGKVERLFGVMKEGLQLTLEIIKSLRNYTGLNQAKFNDVNLRTVAQTSATILRNKLRGKIDVQVDIPENLMIFGSVVGINQVFMNLLSNAIDAMKDGGTLTIKATVDDAQWTTVTVSDTGCGMSQETASRIFEPFFTTKEVGSGTGLGLHIVKGEIERHRGQISVESAPGKGTTFILRFPPADTVIKQIQTSSTDPAPVRSAS